MESQFSNSFDLKNPDTYCYLLDDDSHRAIEINFASRTTLPTLSNMYDSTQVWLSKELSIKEFKNWLGVKTASKVNSIIKAKDDSHKTHPHVYILTFEDLVFY